MFVYPAIEMLTQKHFLVSSEYEIKFVDIL